MSNAQDKVINLEVNGVAVEARPGQMIIEVTDRANEYVPRFCYHRKLSIAANCRMCLVDVEKAPKPLPACATPVAEGMKIFTRSERAISAQKATMEFLLINHPLDCPICDQGGECELQDLAMGFGRGVSRYTERKRVVKDKNLGSLISTDMTRCIHCTRCVRFGEEIAGIPVLGTVGRGENMEISTYIEQSIDHELSGNIIDLCPVGALNNKPFRFNARAWEMIAKPLVSPHDCLGSNMYAHVLRDRVRRVVPRDNDAINESWLSDRDRFSCHGIEADDRIREPLVKKDGHWVSVSWEEALAATRDALQATTADEGNALGVLASPNSTVEEFYLLRRLADALGTRNIDHRLRRRDFADQVNDVPWPWLGMAISEVAKSDAIVLVGSDIRSEVPMLAHHIRKAVTAHGAAFGAINPEKYQYQFSVDAYVAAESGQLVNEIAAVVAAAKSDVGGSVSASVETLISGASITDKHRTLARILKNKDQALLLLGHIALHHPAYSSIRALASALASLTGAKIGIASDGANSAGAAIAGALPHREIGAAASADVGLDAMAMLTSPRRSYILYGAEPDGDFADSDLAENAFKSADTVIALSAFASPKLRECTNILLPIGSFAETPGTYVNAEGTWQSVEAAINAVADARPGWRVLRVLGNLLEVSGFDYQSCGEVLEEIRANVGDVAPNNFYSGDFNPILAAQSNDEPKAQPGIYEVDALVRRSAPLQQTELAAALDGGEDDDAAVRSA